MKRIKRARDFEISLAIHSDEFIRTPRDSQRNWMINRSLKEFADDLSHLDQLAQRFVRGADASQLVDRTQVELDADNIMEDWQIPVMKAMAEVVGESHGSVLEVGFGRGIASTFLQEVGVRSHTIIECNDAVVRRYEIWKQSYSDRRIQLLHGKWQEMIDRLETYDGILFHTYPLNQEEFVEQVAESQTFAEHFFETASKHLRPDGIFTYFTNEIDSISRGHQRSLFRHFRSFGIELCEDLDLPDDTRDALWANSMVLIRVVK